MNVTTLLLASMLTAPAQVPEELSPINDRKFSIPIRFDPAQRAKIQQVMLFVARGQGQPWEQAAVRSPDQDHFPFTAPRDGVYWFNLVIVDNDGRRDPPDLYTSEPQLKVLVDTTKPVLRLKAAEWYGDQIMASWEILEDFPAQDGFQLEYAWSDASAPPTSGWQPVPGANADQGQMRFDAQRAFGGNVAWLRMTVTDLAGNQNSIVRAVSGQPRTEGGVREPVTPEPRPVAPPTPALPTPREMAPPPEPEVFPAGAVASHGGTTSPNAGVQPSRPPEPTWDPTRDVPPGPGPVSSDRVPSPPTGIASTHQPINAQVINVLSFDLGYSVEGTGPSGVGAVELWVTRDDGRTWSRWATDDDLRSPITVNLEGRHNAQPEGYYGFRVVVQSGAGLSKGPPVAGDAPDLRVYVDITRPIVKLWPPTPDPRNRDTLILRWEATDRNLADKPIALEWSESPTGPWRAIAPADQSISGRMSVETQFGTPSIRLPNTGRLGWQVPRDMPTHRVYLRASAVDRAGNEATVVTPDPVEIDLNTPEGRIQGIIGTPR